MVKYFTLIFISILCVKAFPQEASDSLSSLKKSFDNFEYQKVISSANHLLKSKSKLGKGEVIDIYRMKGISSYSLLDKKSARRSFLQILRVDSSYSMDSAKTSPKIISFYNEIKKAYKQALRDRANQSLVIPPDTVYIKKFVPDVKEEENLKGALLRSIVLPGLGHLYRGETTKGWVLTGVSSASLISMIYFIIDANKKENNYLNSTEPASFNSKYNSYNTAYHFRNVSIIAFAAVWLYSQMDLLFFDGNHSAGQIENKNLPYINYSNGRNIEVGFRLRF